jgi:hypothetical protein
MAFLDWDLKVERQLGKGSCLSFELKMVNPK